MSCYRINIVKKYTATEGFFGQKWDELRNIVTNYDLYFEIKQGKQEKTQLRTVWL